MADRMMPPGAPPMGGQPDKPAMPNASIFNPVDVATMKQKGTISPDMTVRDFLTNVLRVDIEGPVSQLIEAGRSQLQNRTGVGKAMNTQGPRPQAPGPQAPAPPAGIEGLMKNIRS